MVLIMVALASIFFLLVDQALSHVVRLVLGVGS
jgi:preprotein translocase subunit SecE